MTTPRSKALWRAIEKNGDKAMSRFFEGLQQHRIMISRCRPCNARHFPPRVFCPCCLREDVTFEEHSGRGTVYSFTTMVQPSLGGDPITVAMVELEGVKGRIFSRVEIPYTEMTIGMAVEVDYFEVDGICLHRFRPAT